MQEGVSGHVVDSLEAAVNAVKKLAAFDRSACRRHFEERFSARRMALDYLRVYERVLAAMTRSGLQVAN